jgi:hypothetical protein
MRGDSSWLFPDPEVRFCLSLNRIHRFSFERIGLAAKHRIPRRATVAKWLNATFWIPADYIKRKG